MSFNHNKCEEMELEESLEEIKMEEESLVQREDSLKEYLRNLQENNSNQTNLIQIPLSHRSTCDLHRKDDLQRMLNSSSSNGKIPFNIHDSGDSSQGLQMGQYVRFKKKNQEDFSVENTIRNLSEPNSEQSDSDVSCGPTLLRTLQVQTSVKKGCSCKRSQCLKMYCDCFQKQLFCTEACNCKGCGNSSENKRHHKAVIQALGRNAHGFQENRQQDFQLGIAPQEVKKGCKCKKTGCIKKYCQCYQNGVLCSVFCRCNGCNNNEHNLHNQAVNYQ